MGGRRMKKFYIAMMAVLLSGSAIAAPVDATSAKEKAAAFLKKQAQHSTNSRRAAALRNPQLTEAQAFGNALHVFNIGSDNGFVIVSGDDRTDEILGYVDEGSFDMNNLPDNAKAWISAVVKQINSGNSLQKAPRKAERTDIPALMTTKWDQYNNYSKFIFEDDENLNGQYGGGSIMTGCVATAMAQVLYNDAKRYKVKNGFWPEISTQVIPSYTINSTTSTPTMQGKTLPELPATTFEWDKMADDISASGGAVSEEQVRAVDKLMMYCGRAMKMEYDASSSATPFVFIPQRISLLGVSPYIQNMDRQYFTTEVWEDAIYHELSEGRAVPYTGIDDNGEGHAYVCDGYQASTGLWHINWGWSGTADGWFSLAVLQPSASGGSQAGGTLDKFYNGQQQITIYSSFEDPQDIKPALCYTHVGGSRGYTSSTKTVNYLIYNLYGGNMTFDGAWAIENNDGTFTILKEDFNNMTVDGFYGDHSSMSLKLSDLTFPGDGTYELKHVTRLSGSTDWNASLGTDEMWFTVTISSGNISNVIAHPQAPSTNNMSATFDFEGDMEANQDNIVHVNVSNLGDDFWGTVRLYYSTSSSSSLPSTYIEQLASIKPNESTVDFTVNLPKGEYKIWFLVNPSGYLSASSAISTGKMFIGYGADANKVQAGNLQFDGQTGTALEMKSVNGVLANELTGSFDITNSSGHTYNNTYYVCVEYGVTKYANVEVPVSVEEGTTTVPFNLGVISGLTSGTTYKVRLYSLDGSTEINVGDAKNLTLQPYFRYWLADGTVKEAKEPTSYYTEGKVMDPDAKANAVAIDLRGINEDYIRMTSNRNCLFYLSGDQSLDSEFSTANKVFGGAAANVKVNANYAFFAPEAFTVEEISFTKTFENGIVKDGAPYWYTIVLPFEVNSVKQGTKNLKWFKKASDKRCHFWLMELTDVAANTLTFDYAQKFEANTPYIIQVPGEGWGDSWNLVGKEITFKGLNVTVPETAFSNETFIGTYSPLTDIEGLILDSQANRFVSGNSVAPYNAYINAADNANSLRIVIAGDEIATGIGQVTIGNDQDLYDLQGRRVQHAQKGLYIQNGKVVVIK